MARSKSLSQSSQNAVADTTAVAEVLAGVGVVSAYFPTALGVSDQGGVPRFGSEPGGSVAETRDLP